MRKKILAGLAGLVMAGTFAGMAAPAAASGVSESGTAAYGCGYIHWTETPDKRAKYNHCGPNSSVQITVENSFWWDCGPYTVYRGITDIEAWCGGIRTLYAYAV
ncbi:DUF6355 family natural product biosynthesis protein [Nonomuraea muscovyensis]|uniref:Uncharacterized protein n=1 Tax=Nonomuraea muscovyensis TaxID=1124761 RepID=A0A7X0CC13_9ACTN|nr:DUF6355 family natural product biosynthesis protein [Nonomuraea muscovyensis]MBB6351361.1 hypothetical protein [Nonomuraea muscovyensis]